eukprot:SAG31_NODE_25002_length_470_cov_0.687332_2_plen_83_part_01
MMLIQVQQLPSVGELLLRQHFRVCLELRGHGGRGAWGLCKSKWAAGAEYASGRAGLNDSDPTVLSQKSWDRKTVGSESPTRPT